MYFIYNVLKFKCHQLAEVLWSVSWWLINTNIQCSVAEHNILTYPMFWNIIVCIFSMFFDHNSLRGQVDVHMLLMMTQKCLPTCSCFIPIPTHQHSTTVVFHLGSLTVDEHQFSFITLWKPSLTGASRHVQNQSRTCHWLPYVTLMTMSTFSMVLLECMFPLYSPPPIAHHSLN